MRRMAQMKKKPSAVLASPMPIVAVSSTSASAGAVSSAPEMELPDMDKAEEEKI